jgi:hypothetical protein
VHYLTIIVDLFIAGTFAVSAAGKLRDRAAFGAAVRDLGGVPARAAAPVAVLVVTLECLTAVLVLVPGPVLPTAGRSLAVALFAAFTVVLVRARRRSPGLACHCFGPGSDAVAVRHVVRNLALLAAGAAALVLGLVQGRTAAVSLAGVALCVLVAGVGVGAVALLDDLAALLRPVPARPAAPDAAR